jgi:hypothetical protein
MQFVLPHRTSSLSKIAFLEIKLTFCAPQRTNPFFIKNKTIEIMSRTVAEIEKEIADIKAANPAWVANETVMKLIAALTEEKLQLSRTLPFILFSAVFYSMYFHSYCPYHHLCATR